MGDWQPWVEAIRADLRQGRLEAATARLAEALAACPDQLWILTTASDVYRAAGDYDTALSYAKQLLRLHPHTYHGYCRGAEDLARQGRREQAHTLIELGLQRFPGEYWVLVVAGELHRQAKRPERSLPLAQRLIATFPEKWEGYAWASADLVALKRFEEALATVRQGLERAGQRQELVRLEAYARRFVGERASGHSLEGASRTTLSLRDMIAYAHLPGYFGDLQSLRSKRSGPRGEGVGKNVLFVAGLGRSGTSALGQLLNLSAAIELYTELYDPGRLNGYEPEDFQLPRLRAALAQHRQAGDGERFTAKHAGSVWIGDKRPNLQFCLEASYDNFVPGHRLCTIYLQRDLRAVLRSSHRRSENREDLSWSLEHGLEHTVLLHNASCRQLIDLQQRRPEVFASIEFVRYAEVFSDPACSQRLFQRLGVELSPAEQGRLSAFLEASAARTPASAKDGDEPDALGARIEAVIARHLDRQAAHSLAAISGLPETCA